MTLHAQLEQDKVRGVGTQRILTDLISPVRHTLQMEDELVPYSDRVKQRYARWLEDQQATGITFAPEQRWWLDRMAEQIGLNLSVQSDDFDYGDFFDKGGRIGAMRALRTEWMEWVEQMNASLVA